MSVNIITITKFHAEAPYRSSTFSVKNTKLHDVQIFHRFSLKDCSHWAAHTPCNTSSRASSTFLSPPALTCIPSPATRIYGISLNNHRPVALDLSVLLCLWLPRYSGAHFLCLFFSCCFVFPNKKPDDSHSSLLTKELERYFPLHSTK